MIKIAIIRVRVTSSVFMVTERFWVSNLENLGK